MDANRRKLLKAFGLGLGWPWWAQAWPSQEKTKLKTLMDLERAQWSGQNELKCLCLGSCNLQSQDQSFWEDILAQSPQAFISLGDNIYGDTFRSRVLREKYQELKNNFYYKKFSRQVPMYGTWDDHDFGWNDSGVDYPLKDESQQLFCDFFNEPPNSMRRKRDGIYESYSFNSGAKEVKLIVLDTRFNKTKTDLLGENQWYWLEEQFQASSAQVHLIATSIPILANPMNFTEDWVDLPKSYQRMFDLLSFYRPPGLVFLSGDKHYGGIFERRIQGHRYIELMSSGLTHRAPQITHPVIRGVFKGERIYLDRNFGQMDFDFEQFKMRLQIKSISGETQIEQLWPIGEFF